MQTPVTQRIVRNVRDELARRGIAQAALARHLYGDGHDNKAAKLLSRRMLGEVTFRADELARVADFLGVTVASLYDEDAA